MSESLRLLVRAATIGAALAILAPVAAQQAAAPTKENPIRFTAFNVSMPTGISGVTLITIERWTTPAERKSLLALVETSTRGQKGQSKLLNALQDIKPRVGFMKTANSLGWDLRYAVENKLPDGMRQIVVATDKPVSFAAATSGARVMEYPFTLIEMRMKPGGEGEGRMLSATSISVKNGRLELENYGTEPVQLTKITEEHVTK